MIVKIAFAAACFSVGLFYTTQAQIKKGSILLGGNISVTSINYKIEVPQDDHKKQRSVFIQPTAGIAIKENTVAGISLGYDFTNADNFGNTVATKRKQYSAGLFLRKYKPVGAGFSFFGQTDVYFTYGEQIFDRMVEIETIKGPTMGLSLYPGLSYTVSKKLQLETGFTNIFNVSYGHENKIIKNKDDGRITSESSTNYFNVQTSLNNVVNFTLGFRLLISR